MKLVRDVVRGNSVQFEANFFDANTNPISPASAVIALAYYANGTPSSTNVSMSASNNTWYGTWSSANADATQVAWTIFALDANNHPLAVSEGTFRVLANLANPGGFPT